MNATPAGRYLEGGNRTSLIIAVLAAIPILLFYGKIASYISKFQIDTQLLYLYVFNLFAIELGALVPLYALLASRPTQFLDRIRGTKAFGLLISNLLITLSIASACVIYTMILAVVKLEPDCTLSVQSVLFLLWIMLCALMTAFYARSLRLTFLALT